MPRHDGEQSLVKERRSSDYLHSQKSYPLMDPDPLPSEPRPSLWQWTLGYLVVGMAWGLTTPFIRKAAVDFQPPKRPFVDAPENGWLKRKVLGAFFTVLDLLRTPKYAIPLLINLTGSVWFFLLVGKAGQ